MIMNKIKKIDLYMNKLSKQFPEVVCIMFGMFIFIVFLLILIWNICR